MSGAGTWEITFSPILPWPAIAILALASLIVLAVGLRSGIGGVLARTAGLGIVLLALGNPRHVEERREPQSDIAVVVVDRSASQKVGARSAQTEAAVAHIRDRLKDDAAIELKVVESTAFDADETSGAGGTELIAPLARAVADIPEARYAGAILVTDGQVHDAATAANLPGGPVHALISGERDTFDRRIVIDRVPAYAIVGKPFDLAFEVIETGRSESIREPVPVELRIDGQVRAVSVVAPGDAGVFSIELDHAGASVVELVTAEAEGELSAVNNSTVASINGVRDRLRVLLVSGQPHPGERTWRNLLKSDPAVDLVHFTILRPPDKSDFTPIRELALISFPTFELFELKLHEFDLVVFDRYIVRFVLSPLYFRNIRDYVTRGGAVMLAVGPEYAGQRSLFDTPLGEISPARPVGGIVETPFRPALTEAGRRHPVTANLGRALGGGTEWGRWLRQIEIEATGGEVLMNGANDAPLLVLGRVEEGRIGVLASDHVWLWARNFEGGGPHAELIRNTAHWLMREPALEEERLSAELTGGGIRVTRRTLAGEVAPVTVRRPDGEREEIALEADADGAFSGRVGISEPGIYRFDDGSLTAHLAVGDIDPLEYRDLRATADLLSPIAATTGGAAYWLQDGFPEVRRPRSGRDMAGGGWLGLRANDAYVVTGLTERPLLPGWLVAVLVVGLLIVAWWRESRPVN